MSYEQEQNRLRKLWDEVDEISDEEPIGSDSDDGWSDHESERSSDSDTEQEIDETENNLPSDQTDQIDDIVDESERPEISRTDNARYMWGKDGKTKWVPFPGNRSVRTRSVNIVTHLPGPKGLAKNAKTPLECWSLFIDTNMLTDIVRHTNVKISEKSQNYNDKHIVKETTLVEMKAVIGLLYLAGLFRSSRQNLEDLWASDGTGVDIFRSTMPLKRFQFILASLRFDCEGTRAERRRTDKLAPFRGIFEKFLDHCKEHYTPAEYMTLDEKLEAFRGRCPFRQYIPNKPAKYGIKVFALVDARTFYAYNLEVYAGKQPEGPFCLSNKPDDIVARLVEPIRGSHRNVTFDNWFASYPLLLKLLNEYKLTAVCTLKKNKREIPPSMLAVRGREVRSSKFAFQSDIMLVSYIPKKGKNVLLFSTFHRDNKIDPSTKELFKPEVITFYNFTKAGVDVLDELSGTYSVSRNSRRWPLTLFFSLLNTAAVNALVICKCNHPNSNIFRRKFLKELGLSLIKEYLDQRRANPHVRRELRRKISEIAGGSNQAAEPIGEQGVKRQKFSRRCSLCPRKSDRKSFYTCCSCNRFICMDHCSRICDECQTPDNL